MKVFEDVLRMSFAVHHICIKAALLCLFCGIADKASADDTDVFFGTASTSGETRPNVMFVLDTSGSMGNFDGFEQSRLNRMKDAVQQLIRSDLDMNIGLMNYSGGYGGGPILYPITKLTEVVCDGTDCGGAEAPADNVYRISDAMGDVEQNTSGGHLEDSGDAMNIGHSSAGIEQAIGLRYEGINIRRGATVLGARLEFVSDDDHEGDATLNIYVENVADSEPFQASNFNVTSRTFHSTTVPWVPDQWYAENIYQSPDIAELVQQIINRDDWCSHNDLSFKIEGVGTRRAWQYEKSVSAGLDYIPRLRIIQDPATAVEEKNCDDPVVTFQKRISESYGDVEQRVDGRVFTRSDYDLELLIDNWANRVEIIGLRFHGIEVPKDAVIESATIRLTYKNAIYNSNGMSLNIYAEDTVTAGEYSHSAVGPARIYRQYLSPPVAWNNIPLLPENAVVDTPDLKALVQSLVSQSDWDVNHADNAISFLLEPMAGFDARRQFYSWEGSNVKAPELVITYSTPANNATHTTATPAFSVNPTTVVVPVTVQARDEMLEVVDGLAATGHTSMIDAFYEAALYMRGEGVDYGRRRGTPDNPRREGFRVSHPESYTGGTVVRDDNCNDGNLNSSACRDEEIIGEPTYISPMLGSCQANHIVLLSAGETNRNSSTSAILSMINKETCEAGDNADEICATDLARWLFDTDHSTDIDDVQNIITHTIALNSEGDGKAFLERVAIAGRGSAHEADTADDLLQVFNDLVTTIADINTGFTAPAVTVNQFNRLTHRDDVYFALYKPEDSTRWNGNIKRFRLGKDNEGNGDVMIRDINGSPAIDVSTGFFNRNSRSWWPERTDEGTVVPTADGNIVARGGVANQLSLTDDDGISPRRIYTWLVDAATPIATPVVLSDVAQKFHESNTLITDAVLNISGEKADDSLQEAYRVSLLQWARGVDVLDSDSDGSTTDVRRSMGDPLHSRPVLVNYASGNGASDVRSLVFVGTNDGFLHAFDSSTGAEEFAFIPYELLGNLHTFFDDPSGFDRPYGLDGPLSVWREDRNNNQMIDSDDTAYLFVGMRRGGSSYYALDISDPDSPKLAWTIKGGPGGTAGFEGMGQSWSRLTPVKMFIRGVAEDVLVFGGGYDENQDPGNPEYATTHTSDSRGNSLYIVKATTGDLLWSGLPVDAGGSKVFSDMTHGFNGNIRTIDINRDGYVDQMYAADAGGKLWRFDITQDHTGQANTLVQGGVIANISGDASADHRRFYNEPDVALIEGDGERFLSVSIGSGWRANPLDEITQDRFYMFRQHSVFDKPDGYGKFVESSYKPLTEADLINVSTSVNPEVNEFGWYLDFSSDGEKVLGTSVTFASTVIFSTYVPTEQTAICAAEIGSGRVYVMDVASGAPVADLDGSGVDVLTLSDRGRRLTRSGIPPDAMVMLTEESGDVPQILIGGERLDTGITNRTRRTFWSDEGKYGTFVVTGTEQD